MNKIYLSKRCLQLLFALVFGSICFFSPGNVLAENVAGHEAGFNKRPPVSGTVKDAVSGQPLIGATIKIKGGTKSTSTDANGSFTIAAPDDNAVLQVSYIGYITQEVPVTGGRVDILLKPDQVELAQVAVVGYGTQNKRDITGSVKSLKSEGFNKGIINSPQQLLQGKIAGVNVTSATGEPGGALSITVRGPGSIRTTSQPLFVVDGLPLDNASTGGTGDPLSFINPQDIESIDVLKDASATAIYGARGANGVVLVTTKRGKAGASTAVFSTSFGISRIANPIKVFSASEFRSEVVKAGGTLDDKGADTDWMKEVTRSALTQNYNLSLSGGSNKLTYYASFGAQLQEGILKKNFINRYTGRFNATQRFLDDKLVIEANLNVSNTRNERPPITTLIGDALANNPTYAPYDANGKPANFTSMNNPVLSMELDKDITTITRVIGNISPSITIIKGLVYKLNFGIDRSDATRDVEALPYLQPARDGRLETFNRYNRNTLIENYLTYNLIKNKHNISALAGYSYQKIYLQGRNTSINKLPIIPIDPIYNPGVGTELTLANNRPGGYATIDELQSFFGRITYQYNNKYLLTTNFRADGSTKFGSNNVYGYFPSFSLGWKISEENFMKNSMFSVLKLRAGYGITGSQEIFNKQTKALFQSSTGAGFSYPLYPSGAYPSGIVYTRLANPDLQWEQSEQYDLGLDFAIWNGVLSGTIDVFKKISSNVLQAVNPADPIQPASSGFTNVKDMEIINKGIELEMDYRQKTSIGVTFNVGGNVSYIKNEVKNSPYSIIPSGSAQGSGLTSATINGYLNGEPIGTFYLLQWTGIGSDGISTFLDRDKDGIISDKDRMASGTALPKVIYSFYGGASYKGFDLNINFNGLSGNKIYDNTANSLFYKAKIAKNVNTTREATLYANESTSNPARVSSRYLKNGSYLRLNNASLGYNFNTNKLGISKWIPALRLSVTGQNLFVITKYDGFDPEVNIDRQIDNVYSYGVDYLSYPKSRSVIFSLNVTF
jgi:TonB-dependent starch-binding outer membrane protein SusC